MKLKLMAIVSTATIALVAGGCAKRTSMPKSSMPMHHSSCPAMKRCHMRGHHCPCSAHKTRNCRKKHKAYHRSSKH